MTDRLDELYADLEREREKLARVERVAWVIFVAVVFLSLLGCLAAAALVAPALT